MKYPNRHYLRLDNPTQDALAELCRYKFATKSELMRRYVQEGVEKDSMMYQDQVRQLVKSTSVLRRI